MEINRSRPAPKVTINKYHDEWTIDGVQVSDRGQAVDALRFNHDLHWQDAERLLDSAPVA